LDSLHQLWERYRDSVAFCVVYIREAHPEDGWVLTVNRDQGISVTDPTTDAERHDLTAACALRLKIRMPVVIDSIDDRVARAYGALPDRLYLVGKGGRIAFQGSRGPMGFRPPELQSAIEKELARLDRS
jgi:hypothetical protein